MKNLFKIYTFPRIAKFLHFNNPSYAIDDHDKKMLDFYSQFISHGELAFDVGANIGNRTKIFLALGLRVIAIEPQKHVANLLTKTYGANKHLTILQEAVGPSTGDAQIMISNANTISSMSKDWIEAVKSSGRFSDYSWDNSQTVSMTTLDKLIETYGTPSLIKIDVEGFEFDVIKGLSTKIKFISFEFTPEFLDSTYKCIKHLETLGEVQFNYSLEESMELALEKYVSSKSMIEILDGYKHDNYIFGDIYCHFINC